MSEKKKNFDLAYEDGMNDFELMIEPLLKNYFGAESESRLVNMKESKTDFDLDSKNSIDGFLKIGEKEYAFGLRIQPGENYKSFTIRKSRESGKKTEYEKICNNIKNEKLYPYFFIQAYVYRRTVSSCAFCRTIDLIDYIKAGKAEVKITGKDQIGQAKFFVIYWRDLIKLGVKIRVYTKEKGCFEKYN